MDTKLPESVMRVKLRPNNPKDLDLLFFSVRTALATDPILKADFQDKCVVLKGMGELHLKMSVKRVVEYFGENHDGIDVEDTSVIFSEPIMHVAVITPDEFVLAISSELDLRHPEKQHVEQYDGTTTITVCIPLMKLKGLVNSLRELTAGKARSVLTPCGYQEINHKELFVYLLNLVFPDEGEKNGS